MPLRRSKIPDRIVQRAFALRVESHEQLCIEDCCNVEYGHVILTASLNDLQIEMPLQVLGDPSLIDWGIGGISGFHSKAYLVCFHFLCSFFGIGSLYSLMVESMAVTSLCWQRSKPILVNETNCSLEAALLGGAGEDSILMPDPLPASTSLSHGSASLTTAPARSSGRLAFGTADSSPISVSGISVASAAARTSPGEDNLGGNHLWTNGTMSRLQTRNNFSFKDDMEVFSPLVDVQPITPSVASYWDNRDDLKKEGGLGDNSRKVAWNPSPPSAIRRFPSIEELSSESYLNFDRRSISTQIYTALLEATINMGIGCPSYRGNLLR
eukprot:Gb_17227 [translate_table: standard]